MTEASTSDSLGVLEAVWAAIRQRHPELPSVVIIIAPGSDRRQGLFKWGHFAALRWRTRIQGGGALSEVLIAGEGLRRPGEDVLTTLLHEAAHALAHVRGVKDTSRGGRYHNDQFRLVGEELGLTIAQSPPFGWASASLSETAIEVYQAQLEVLRPALGSYRLAESARADVSRTAHNLQVAVCGCDRRIRIAASTLAAGPVVCGLCGKPFTPPRRP
jgi:hypothetical protein